MSPYEKMAEWYAANPQAQPFEWYVDFHLRNGFVFANPEYFMMGRPVNRWASEALICEPTHAFPHELCNCWYIHAAAGNVAKAWDIMPWPLGWIAFERTHDGKRELQIVETSRLRRLSVSTIDENIPA